MDRHQFVVAEHLDVREVRGDPDFPAQGRWIDGVVIGVEADIRPVRDPGPDTPPDSWRLRRRREHRSPVLGGEHRRRLFLTWAGPVVLDGQPLFELLIELTGGKYRLAGQERPLKVSMRRTDAVPRLLIGGNRSAAERVTEPVPFASRRASGPGKSSRHSAQLGQGFPASGVQIRGVLGWDQDRGDPARVRAHHGEHGKLP